MAGRTVQKVVTGWRDESMANDERVGHTTSGDFFFTL